MDEVTHELWTVGKHKLDFNIRTGRVKLKDGTWSRGEYSAKQLKLLGWELIPVHVELENK